MLPLSGRWIGKSVPRVEDSRLLLARGRFMADLRFPGALQAAFVRSPHAHARVLGVDGAAATGVAGVHTILSAADLDHEPLVDLLAIDGLRKTPQPALAGDRVRFAGEGVAMVLADSRYEAEDGAERVVVAYEPLPTVVEAEASTLPTAPVLFPELGSNIVYEGRRSFGDPAGAFAAAAHVSRLAFRGNRYLAAPLEPRGCAAEYEPSTGSLTFWSST